MAGGCAGKGPTQPNTVANGCSGPLAIELRAMFLGREYERRVEGGCSDRERRYILGEFVVVDVEVSWKGGQQASSSDKRRSVKEQASRGSTAQIAFGIEYRRHKDFSNISANF